MPGNVPNVSRDSFDAGKVYDKVTLQQGVPIPDSDWNELNDVLRMAEIMASRAAIGNMPLPVSPAAGLTGYKLAEAAPNVNDFTIEAGWFMVEGVLVPTTFSDPPTNHDYEDDTNRIGEGEVTAAASPVLTDVQKNWQAFHDLLPGANHGPCRVKMLTGAEAGNTFTITAYTATTLTLSGLPAIAPGDQYLVKPPALTTPGAVRTDLVRVHVWWEDINREEDPNVQHPGLGAETAHRQQRRWCVRVDENLPVPPPASPALGFGPRWAIVGFFQRTASANLVAAEIQNYTDFLPANAEFLSLFNFEFLAWLNFGQKFQPNVWSAAQTFNDPVTFNDTADFNSTVTFDDGVTFNEVVTFNDTLDLVLDLASDPLLRVGSSTALTSHVLLYEAVVKADGRKVRIYATGTGPVANQIEGLQVTVNAKWTESTASWSSDITTQPAALLDFDTDAGLSVYGISPNLMPSWVDGDWGVEGQGSINILDHFVANFPSVERALFSSTNGPADDPDFPASLYKLLFQFSTSTTDKKVRFYVARDTGILGQLVVTVNAAYDPATALWTADSTAFSAVAWGLVVFSSLLTGLRLVHKETTAAPWADAAWDFVPATAGNHGNHFVSGDFKYLASRARTTHANIYAAMQFTGGGDYFADALSHVGLQASAIGAELIVPLHIPHGATFDGIDVLHTQSSAVANLIQVHRRASDFATPALVASVSLAALAPPASSGTKYTTVNFTHLANNTTNQYFLVFAAAAVNNVLADVRIRWSDPGPRND